MALIEMTGVSQELRRLNAGTGSPPPPRSGQKLGSGGLSLIVLPQVLIESETRASWEHWGTGGFLPTRLGKAAQRE